MFRVGRRLFFQVLVNMDNDRVFPSKLVQWLLALFGQRYCDVLHCTDPLSEGTVGCIGYTAEAFAQLGGYDESLYPSGFQDLDLVNRAKAAQFRVQVLRDREAVGWSMPNATEAESRQDLRNVQVKTRNCDPNVHGKWGWWDQQNGATSAANIAAGRLQANASAGRAPLRLEAPSLGHEAWVEARPPQARPALPERVAMRRVPLQGTPPPEPSARPRAGPSPWLPRELAPAERLAEPGPARPAPEPSPQPPPEPSPRPGAGPSPGPPPEPSPAGPPTEPSPAGPPTELPPLPPRLRLTGKVRPPPPAPQPAAKVRLLPTAKYGEARPPPQRTPAREVEPRTEAFKKEVPHP